MPFPYLKMLIARSDITIGDTAGELTALPFPYLKIIDRAIEDLTIDDMAAGGHGTAVSLPQNVDRTIKYNHPQPRDGPKHWQLSFPYLKMLNRQYQINTPLSGITVTAVS